MAIAADPAYVGADRGVDEAEAMIRPDRGRASLAALLLVLLGALPTMAAETARIETEAVTARLITAEDSVAPKAATVSAGLHLDLAKGWKTYWRSPGEVGFPPEIDWTGSANIAAAEMLWPAPTRFRAFGIENFGYEDGVVFPLRLRLAEPGAPARLRARVTLLVCSTICIPQEFALALDLPAGTGGIDAGSAELIAAHAARVPGDGSDAGFAAATAALAEDGRALTVTLRSAVPLSDPDLFPEMGPEAAFGAPDIRLGEGGRLLWARLPVLSPDPPAGPLTLTVTDGQRAATLDGIALAPEAPAPPYAAEAAAPGVSELVWIALAALLGGLILNAMPCVLPVLSIKLASAMKQQGRGPARIRTGFLVSALGVLTFMWMLAGATLALRAAGVSVGWGLQFQNPVFLALMIAVLALFAANLAGLFEISLPSAWSTALARAEDRRGLLGDFATGAFAAVLATPCSAPFLGTAIAFALSGRAVDVLLVFTALGLGLALPYLAVATRPGLVAALPRPGRWMVVLKLVLGALLALTAGWLLWVLAGVAGEAVTATVALAVALVVLLLWQGSRVALTLRAAGVAGLLALAMLAPAVLTPPPPAATETGGAVVWTGFDRAAIPRLVSQGEVVLVDVTADWCLTCKANKALVLDRDPVAAALAGDGVTAMQADWTRQDPAISRYLAEHDRYAIPFNIVYGPGAPEGILLPELLSATEVMQALERAGTMPIAAGG